MATQKEMCRAFSQNLRRLMNEKGWNNSDMARAAFDQTGAGDGAKGRDNIGNYVHARSFPTSVHLTQIAKALGAERSDLIPAAFHSTDSADPVPFNLETLSNGNALVRMHQEVPMEVAMKIMALLYP